MKISPIQYSINMTVPYLLLVGLSFFLQINESYGQKAYFQQKVDIKMDVTLDDEQHLIHGDWEMTYYNNSPDTLSFILLHLWPNAYRNKGTAFAQQQKKLNQTKFYFSPEEDRGEISDLAFQAGEKLLQWEYYPDRIDIAKVLLTGPLFPGDSVRMSSPFTVKIPKSFSRLGHLEQSYQITQWYPKPAVYDRDGWHQMSYLGIGEFYSEFGNYEVSLTLPENYYVGATGVLQDTAEIDRLENRRLETEDFKSSESDDLNEIRPSSKVFKTITYKAEQVHDFAWFADKRFLIESEWVRIGDRDIQATVMYLPENRDIWKDALTYITRAVQFYSDKVGPYPYPQVTAVDGALAAGGGMEYPMITVIGQSSSPQELDRVITHEVGHNWFYGILAFNERDHAWLDEGINSYYEHQYMDKYYPEKTGNLPKWLISDTRVNEAELLYQYKSALGREVAPCRHIKMMGNLDYYLGAYEKPAMSFTHLMNYLGEHAFDQCMQSFYEDWKFRHPGPDDFRGFLETCSGENLSWLFDKLICSNQKIDMYLEKKNGKLHAGVKGVEEFPLKVSYMSGDSVVNHKWLKSDLDGQEIEQPGGDIDRIEIDPDRTFWDPNRRNNSLLLKGDQWKPDRMTRLKFLTGLKDQKTRNIYAMPIMGGNSYDGFQFGAAIHNIGLPMGDLEYYVAPMFATRSNAITGLVDLGYYFFFNDGFVNSLRFGVSFMSFHERERLRPVTNELLYLRFVRTEISAEIDLKTNLSANYQSKITLRNITLGHEVWEPSSTDPNPDFTRYLPTDIYEMRYTFAKRSKINPFSLVTALEYQDYTTQQRTENYLKLWVELITNYTFAEDKHFTIRAFAGTFLINSHRELGFINAGSGRGNFSLFGNSALDYKYDEIFVGRGRLTGLGAQQVSISDGGFKNAITPIFDDGVTNNYLFAVNLSSDLPQLPKWLPIRPYFDAGYTASFAGRGRQGPFDPNVFWSGGAELRLFRGLLSIYVPIINSENINRFYGEQGSFWRRISFSWQLGKRRPGDIAREIEFLGLF